MAIKRVVRTAACWVLLLSAAASCRALDEEQTAAMRQEMGGRVSDFLRAMEGRWSGTLWLHKADGSVEMLQMDLEHASEESNFGGHIFYRSVGDAPDLSASSAMEFRDSWQGYEVFFAGVEDGMVPWVPADAKGKREKRSVIWSGPESQMTMTQMGETRMDMLWTGRWPLPDGIDATGVVGQTARLRKEGFHLMIGPFELVVMEFVGIFATLFFASRFVIQWIASERAKRSVMPELFWWVSLIGSGLMLIYAIHFGRLAVLLGQLTGWTVYVRNIWLIEREKRQRRHEASQQE